jgi:hypothetical protein
MPVSHRAVKATGCTIAVWDGTLTSADMQHQLIRLANDPEWPPGPCHLVDCTTLETVIVPDPGLMELLYEGTNFVSEIRIAVVVRPDFFDAVRDRFHTAVEAFDAATFFDVETACAYLGVDASVVRSTIEDLRHELGPTPTP